MPFDLRCRNKELDDFEWSASSWPLILEMGIGLPIGYVAGIEPGTFVCTTDRKGRCIAFNDGAHVTAQQAKQMAQITRWIAQTQRAKQRLWDQYTSRRRTQLEKYECTKKPYDMDLVDKLERFATWLERSGGFKVY